MMPDIREEMWKMLLFKEKCRRSKSNAVHNIDTEADHLQEPAIETVNFNSIRFNTNHSAIKVDLKTSSNKGVATMPYKVDMGSDGNIMPLYI